MYSLKIYVYVVLVAMLLLSCATSGGDRQAFLRMLNNLVGEDEEILTGAPKSISDLGKVIRKVYSTNDSKCLFFVDVNKLTKEIIRVGYLSDPENCYLSTDWFSPW